MFFLLRVVFVVGSLPPCPRRGCDNSVLFVTAFQDIHRENIDGRSFSDYLRWFGYAASAMRHPMVVYAPPERVGAIKAVLGPGQVIRDVRSVVRFSSNQTILARERAAIGNGPADGKIEQRSAQIGRAHV